MPVSHLVKASGAATLKFMMDIGEKSEKIRLLLDDRFGSRGRDLRDALERVGRILPKPMLEHARLLAAAAEMEANPKLAKQIDHAKINRAFKELERHLKRIGRKGRAKALGWSILTTGAGNLVLVIAGLIGILLWRGLI